MGGAEAEAGTRHAPSRGRSYSLRLASEAPSLLGAIIERTIGRGQGRREHAGRRAERGDPEREQGGGLNSVSANRLHSKLSVINHPKRQNTHGWSAEDPQAARDHRSETRDGGHEPRHRHRFRNRVARVEHGAHRMQDPRAGPARSQVTHAGLFDSSAFPHSAPRLEMHQPEPLIASWTALIPHPALDSREPGQRRIRRAYSESSHRNGCNISQCRSTRPSGAECVTGMRRFSTESTPSSLTAMVGVAVCVCCRE